MVLGANGFGANGFETICFGAYGRITMQDWRRTHRCGDLRANHIGTVVRLNGWVNSYRGYGQQVFLDLRDRFGITQVVVEATKENPALFQLAD